jgi:adenylosuccinate synthase
VALKRSVLNNSISGLAVTKLDVLDGLDTLRICTGYRIDGRLIDAPPLASYQYEQCEAVYEDLPGWKSSTVGITDYDALPENAKLYLQRMAEVTGVPIALVSTGPDRAHTICCADIFGDE